MADTQAPKTQITLHWLERSRAQRIVWLLRSCKDIDYKLDLYKRGADGLAKEDLKKAHPLGKSPVITITSPNSTTPVTLAESGLITEYVSEHYAPQLIPTRWRDSQEGKAGGETEAYLRWKFYMHYAEGSLMAILLISHIMNQLKDGPAVPFFVKPLTRAVAGKIESAFLNQNLATQFGFLESQVSTSPDGGSYLCGKELTSADMLMSFPLMAAKPQLPEATYPKLRAYIARLEAEPSFKESVAEVEKLTGEPYKIL
ncbi:hypothetical protein B0A48_10066 [Cryoendolithus antarcticus]|uniref:GST N-terminal domain-containing protein n=1 Tax=Cryoendolithus antarcticus TaxID=1507870 RepID=A0A1V8T3Q8_9PEZI|nr:hypothetical protein B0A48_10066 [Cryoendolithus antarcticus]